MILAVVIALVLMNLPLPIEPQPQPRQEAKKFNSLDEIKSFLKSSETYNYGYYGRGEIFAETMPSATTEDSAGAAKAAASADSYSTTNIQVEGVDEPDIVKNDGKYIYTVSGTKVVIVNAYPAENMKILSEIDLDNYISNIFINKEKLIIFSQDYDYSIASSESKVACASEDIRGGCIPPRTSAGIVYIYDVSDREEPELENKFSIEGDYQDSRMIGDYVYVIAQKYAYYDNPEPPVYTMNDAEVKVMPNEVYYFDYPDSSYVFTSIMALNINGDTPKIKTYLTGYTGTLYVSESNIYLTSMKNIPFKDYVEKYVDEVVLPILPSNEKEKINEIMDSDKEQWEKMSKISEIVQKYSNSLDGNEKENFDNELMEKLEDFQMEISKETQKTVIHKISVDKDKIDYKKSGEVPGTVLNQFSMDEYDGHFRITTTTGETWRETSLNHLYILNGDMKIVGSVEDLAKGERIYSTRFLGDKAYVVTFKQVDPLFVIDLSNPSNPEVLGYLKVTGYSSYLHPYDENHIIGIGMEANEQGRVEGLKIALFDVSDVENPEEIGKYEIEKGEGWVYSEASYDHKAFLFDKGKNLLVIPISISNYAVGKYSNWQGAYVFDIDLDGISLKGKVEHETNETQNYWRDDAIRRSLYMDDVLYTISSNMIKANDLDSIDEINYVKLPVEERNIPVYAETGI